MIVFILAFLLGGDTFFCLHPTSLVGAGQESHSVGPGPTNPYLWLPSEEELLYSAKYGMVKAGEINLYWRRDSLNYIRCEQETKGFFSFVFKVKDWYESVSDSNFVTKRFEKNIQEGKYRKYQLVNIVKGYGVYQDSDTVEVIDDAKDIINLIYWLRTQELIPGDTIIVPLHADKKNHLIKTSVIADTIDGKPCILLIPNLAGIKAFGGDGGLLLYYNESKVPVLLKIKFLWGYLEAKLERREWE